MTRARPIGWCLLIFLAAAFAVAQDGSIASPREIWPQATAAVDAGDLATGDKKLTEMLEVGKTLGIRRFPLSAESAASLARQAHKAGNSEVSGWAARAAEQLDPESPTVDFTLADLAAEQGRWPAVFRELMAGFGHSFADYKSRSLTQADLAMVAGMALALAAAVFAVILFFRYSRAAAHDFREILGTRFRAGMGSVLAFALLFAPIFLWLGPLWLILYWLILFFGYASGPERVISIILLLILAVLPIAADWNAYRIAGLGSPVVRAAISSMEKAYHPEAYRRLSELAQLLPEEAKVHLLLGNLEVQHGNESQALVHYRKAAELDDRLAGAHLNIGNLHFFNNDFQAALTQYQKAAETDSSLAIAFYNQSVASGELYKFDEQGQQLEEAKNRDRTHVEEILSNPPPQKIAMYDLPISDAWELSTRIAKSGVARELFGNYASFNPVISAQNPITLGALMALIFGPLLWIKRKRAGFAGACIKCGRTFCHRCKVSRESATYCTQCIHIYLKRDGVSIDTKRAKVTEVQNYQTRSLRFKKLFASFFPGSGQIIDGSTVRGVIALLLFLLCVAVALFTGRLAPIATPAETMRMLIRIVAIAVAIVIWFAVLIPTYRQKVVI